MALMTVNDDDTKDTRSKPRWRPFGVEGGDGLVDVAVRGLVEMVSWRAGGYYDEARPQLDEAGNDWPAVSTSEGAQAGVSPSGAMVKIVWWSVTVRWSRALAALVGRVDALPLAAVVTAPRVQQARVAHPASFRVAGIVAAIRVRGNPVALTRQTRGHRPGPI